MFTHNIQEEKDHRTQVIESGSKIKFLRFQTHNIFFFCSKLVPPKTEGDEQLEPGLNNDLGISSTPAISELSGSEPGQSLGDGEVKQNKANKGKHRLANMTRPGITQIHVSSILLCSRPLIQMGAAFIFSYIYLSLDYIFSFEYCKTLKSNDL